MIYIFMIRNILHKAEVLIFCQCQRCQIHSSFFHKHYAQLILFMIALIEARCILQPFMREMFKVYVCLNMIEM